MPDSDIKVRKRIYRQQLVAYVLIVVFASIGFWKMQKNQDDLVNNYNNDQIDRCISGQELRDATRANVEAVYQLAISFVDPNPNATPQQRREQQAYLDRVEAFRNNTLKKVPPVAEGCEEIIAEREKNNE